MIASGNMRMAAGNHVGTHANRNVRPLSVLASCGLIEQHTEFAFGFRVEQQDSTSRVLALAAIVQCKPNFFTRFSNSGKNNFMSGNVDTCEVFQLPAGNYIESATKIR